MNNQISVLVIGKSGTGKSEFILSLIDEKQREKIPASGETQTTRSSIEYNIDFKDEQELQFEIQLKSKKEFVEERMNCLESYFMKEGNSLADFSTDSEDNFLIYLEDLMDSLIFDDAFFNCKEFGKGDEIKELFGEKFSELFWRDFKDCDYSKPYEKDSKNETLLDQFNGAFREFFGKIYDICRPVIKQNSKVWTITEKDVVDIERFLKVPEDGMSYSALVKKITVSTTGASFYKDIFERNRIDKVTLVDTYGLDHAEQYDEMGLKRRYESLLREEFPNIKAVFYLRNIASSASPSDLKTGIQKLFEVEPSVVPYIIFTFADKIYNPDNLEAYKETKVYTSIESNITSMKKILVKSGVSVSLITKRIEEILKTRIVYASKIEDNTYEEQLLEQNKKNLEGILSSIRFEKHLGNAYIPVDLMKLDMIGKTTVLSVEQLFKSRNLTTYPSATKGAIRKKIQSETDRVLGFRSSTMPSTCWSDILANDLNSRFTNIIGSYKWKEYLTQKVEPDKYSEVIGAIEELFIMFSKTLYFGSSDRVDLWNLNYYGNLIIKNIYEDRKSIIEDGYFTVGQYLTDIYSFEELTPETKEKLQKLINQAYSEWFISKCRIHNARKLAERITENTSYKEKEQMLGYYYENYDSQISDEEKEEFEVLVSDNMII